MRICLVVSVAACAACSEPEVVVGDLDEIMVLPAIQNRDLDLLFVIDNSPSMADKQASLVANFPRMMDALATLPGGLPNLHIGVVTSDMGTTGSADPAPGPAIGSGPGGCAGHGDDGALRHAALVTGAYISDVGTSDGTRTRNYTGELRDVFAQLATVGANGCGFEQHLAAMRSALGDNPANAGFVRPSANLGVIILADEDDCSLTHAAMLAPDTATLGPLESFRCTRFGLTCDDGGATPDDMNAIGPKSRCHARTDSAYVEDVAPFVDLLTTVKGDPRAVMVAAIVGDPTPVATELVTPPGGGTAIPALAHSCTFAGPDGVEVADPAARIGQVVQNFPGRSAMESVCNADLTLPLTTIGVTAKQLVGDPCVESALVDTSSDPGIQPLCDVVDGDTALPACDGTTSGDCWLLVTDAATCPTSPNNLRFNIVRTSPPVAQRYTRISCLTAH